MGFLSLSGGGNRVAVAQRGAGEGCVICGLGGRVLLPLAGVVGRRHRGHVTAVLNHRALFFLGILLTKSCNRIETDKYLTLKSGFTLNAY